MVFANANVSSRRWFRFSKTQCSRFVGGFSGPKSARLWEVGSIFVWKIKNIYLYLVITVVQGQVSSVPINFRITWLEHNFVLPIFQSNKLFFTTTLDHFILKHVNVVICILTFLNTVMARKCVGPDIATWGRCSASSLTFAERTFEAYYTVCRISAIHSNLHLRCLTAVSLSLWFFFSINAHY